MMSVVEFNVVRRWARGWRWPAVGWVLAAAAWMAVLAGCSGESSLVDDRNPFYVKGLRLRQENRYTDAAEAFEKCLRLSPASAKAHLQLAMLYEDRLNDPVRAIYHYRAYLVTSPNGENADMVRKWLVRAERSYLQKLMRQYPDDVDVLTNNGAQPGVPAGVTPREIQLARRLKEVSLELNQAREEARRVAGPAAGRPGEAEAVGLPGLAPGAGARSVEGGGADLSPGTSEPEVGGAPVLPVGDGPPVEAATGETSVQPVKVVSPSAAVVVPRAPPPVPVAAGESPLSSVTPSSGSAVKGGGKALPPAVAAGRSAGTVTGGRPFKPLWRLTPGRAVPATVSGPAPNGGRAGATVHHTVQSGETLSGLARKYYGRPGAWTRIRDANPTLRNGGSLRPGMQVVIP